MAGAGSRHRSAGQVVKEARTLVTTAGKTPNCQLGFGAGEMAQELQPLWPAQWGDNSWPMSRGRPAACQPPAPRLIGRPRARRPAPFNWGEGHQFYLWYNSPLKAGVEAGADSCHLPATLTCSPRRRPDTSNENKLLHSAHSCSSNSS